MCVLKQKEASQIFSKRNHFPPKRVNFDSGIILHVITCGGECGELSNILAKHEIPKRLKVTFHKSTY